MTPDELRAALDRVFPGKAPQRQAAVALQRDQGTVSRWCLGKQAIPAELPLLLHAWERHPDLVPR